MSDILDSFMTNPSRAVPRGLQQSSGKKQYNYTKQDLEELRRIEEENRRLEMEMGMGESQNNYGHYQPADNEFEDEIKFGQQGENNQFGRRGQDHFSFQQKQPEENDVDQLLKEMDAPYQAPNKTSQGFFKWKEPEQQKSSLFADLDNQPEPALSQYSNNSKRPQTADVAIKKAELFGIKPKEENKKIVDFGGQVVESIIPEAPLNIKSRRRQKGVTTKINVRPKTALGADSRQSYENTDGINTNLLQDYSLQPQLALQQQQIQSYSKQLSDFYEARWIELQNNYSQQVKIIKDNFEEEAKHLRQLNEKQLENSKKDFEEEMKDLDDNNHQGINRMNEMSSIELVQKEKQYNEELQGLRKQNQEYEAMLSAYKNFKIGEQELRNAVDKIAFQDNQKFHLENYGDNESFAMKNIQLNEKERKIKALDQQNNQEKLRIQEFFLLNFSNLAQVDCLIEQERKRSMRFSCTRKENIIVAI